MKYGLIAERLGHSYSGEIHSLIGGYEYELRELSRDELPGFMQKRDFLGINVTIPYKKEVMKYLDEISDGARRIGSVNTVINRGGRLLGYNTDCYGMTELLKKSGIELSGRKVLILGTGGTSVTARVVAEDLGAREIITVSRTKREGVVTYAEARELHRDAQVIINTSPAGMYPDNYDYSQLPLEPADFPKLEGLMDAVFNPDRTLLVQKALNAGAKAVGGLYMLAAQAVRASEIFRDVSIPKTETDRVYAGVRGMKINIVLTGMPASGKTTAGERLAKLLGRELIDTDREIVARVGRPIPEIFAELGEEGFRGIETEVIKDVSRRSGVVISTGGGAILREENVTALRQNGKIYFLDRPLEWLRPTSDRPTASDFEAIKKRFDERYGRYVSTADRVIKPSEQPDETAKYIAERFLNEDIYN